MEKEINYNEDVNEKVIQIVMGADGLYMLTDRGSILQETGGGIQGIHPELRVWDKEGWITG